MVTIGTWSSDVFDDDLALDIKDEFESGLSEELSIPGITKEILENYEDVINDEDEGSIVYLALAALQIKHGHLQPKIKKEALKIIDKGKGLERWEEAGEEVLSTRQMVLQELKKRLLNI